MTFRKNVTATGVDSRNPLARAAAFFRPTEDLEPRTLFCALHTGQSVDALLPTAAAIQAALAKHTPKSPVKDHAASWYKAARKVTIKSPLASSSTAVPVRGANAVVTAPVTFSTNAAGLPLLTSRADGNGMKVFLDFDGYGAEIPFDMSVDQGGDGNGATFNATEQSVIYGAWRDIVSYFSALNVNVTTVQPATGGANPNFVWHRITDSVSGGAAYVGAINNTTSQGWTDDSNAISRHSGIAHEIAHQLSLSHQADWNNDATKLNEYSSGYTAHGPIIGVDFAQQVHKWFYGRNSDAADRLQNDLAQMTGYMMMSRHNANVGDGYRPDDFTGTSSGTAAAITPTNGSFQTSGIIERATDVDWFSFTSTGSAFNVNAEPTFESPIALKLEVYDSNGTLLATKDDTGVRGWQDNTGQEVNLDLAAGTYYAKVSGHGDYGDIGEYAFYASPMPSGFTSRDITQSGTGRGGYATYDASNGNWFVGGSGNDIHSTADNFRFVYQTLTGNGSITARMTGVDNTNTYAKAGVMLRETLTSASRNAFNYFTPTASETGYRTTTGGETGHGIYGPTTPGWIRLTRTGDTVTFFGSPDGNTFTQIGSPITLSSLANQVYIGMAVTSHDTKKLATAGFTNVTLTGTLGTTPTFNSLPAPTNLTAAAAAGQTTAISLAWSDTVGETGYAVERSVDGVNWSQIGQTGLNVTTYTDNLSFGAMRWWYRVSALGVTSRTAYSTAASAINKPAAPTLPQAVVMSGTSLSLTWRDTNAETGYRLERSTNGGSTYTTLLTLPANITGYNNNGLTAGTTYLYRVTPLGIAGDGLPLLFNAATTASPVTIVTAPAPNPGGTVINWVDVANETGYRVERSTDRSAWTAVGSVGANVTALTDSTTAPLTRYYYRVIPTTAAGDGPIGTVLPVATRNSIAIASPWASADVGVTGGIGASFINSSGVATVLGSGDTAATAAADGYQFLYRTLTGDGEIVAHVTGLDAASVNAKAGVMIRDGVAADAKTASVMVQGGNLGTDLFYRTTAGAAGVAVDGPAATNYSYLRLVRLGTTVTAYASTTNGNWTQIGTPISIALGSTTYVGLAASSRDATLLTQATFDQVAVNAGAPLSVSGFVVNDGLAQRSMVQRALLNFSEPVALTSDAVTLQRKQPDGTYVTVTGGYALVPVTASTYSQSYRLQFSGNSLADGRYRVLVTGTGVGGTLGNTMATNTTFEFHRLFGDADGDGGVSINDFNGFAAAFGAVSPAAAFNAAFDFDGDAGISINDFNEFSSRFSSTV